jgi:hypothetical protein
VGGIIALYHDGSPEHDHAHVPKPAHTRVPKPKHDHSRLHEGSQKGVAAAQEFLAGWPQRSRLHGSVD